MSTNLQIKPFFWRKKFFIPFKHKNWRFTQKYYGKNIEYHKGLCPTAEKILETAIKLPVNEFYTEQDMEDVIAGIRKVAKYYLTQSKWIT